MGGGGLQSTGAAPLFARLDPSWCSDWRQDLAKLREMAWDGTNLLFSDWFSDLLHFTLGSKSFEWRNVSNSIPSQSLLPCSPSQYFWRPWQQSSLGGGDIRPHARIYEIEGSSYHESALRSLKTLREVFRYCLNDLQLILRMTTNGVAISCDLDEQLLQCVRQPSPHCQSTIAFSAVIKTGVYVTLFILQEFIYGRLIVIAPYSTWGPRVDDRNSYGESRTPRTTCPPSRFELAK